MHVHYARCVFLLNYFFNFKWKKGFESFDYVKRKTWLLVKVKVSDSLVVESSVEHVVVGINLPFIQPPADNRQNRWRLSSCGIGIGEGYLGVHYHAEVHFASA